MSASLSYWTGSDGLIKFFLSWLKDWFNLPVRDRVFFSNVNGISISNESIVGCLEDTSYFLSSEEAGIIWEAEALLAISELFSATYNPTYEFGLPV